MRTESTASDGRTAGGDPASEHAGLSRAQSMTLIAAFPGWMFDGLEMGIFPAVAPPALQELQAAAGIVDENFVRLWMGRTLRAGPSRNEPLHPLNL